MKWINQYWAHFGLFAAIAIAGGQIFFRSGWSYSQLQFILLALLMFHQFEEYALPGGFREYYNSKIYGKTRLTGSRLSSTGVLGANVVMGWTMYVLVGFYPKPLLVASLIWITLFNAFLHIWMAIRTREYNPGLLTSIFLFLPFCLYFLCEIRAELNWTMWVGSFGIFIAGSLMIPLMIRMTSK